jgi:hypothetical protein
MKLPRCCPLLNQAMVHVKDLYNYTNNPMLNGQESTQLHRSVLMSLIKGTTETTPPKQSIPPIVVSKLTP